CRFQTLTIPVAPEPERQTAACSETDVTKLHCLIRRKTNGVHRRGAAGAGKRHAVYCDTGVDPVRYISFHYAIGAFIDDGTETGLSRYVQVVIGKNLNWPTVDIAFVWIFHAVD